MSRSPSRPGERHADAARDGAEHDGDDVDERRSPTTRRCRSSRMPWSMPRPVRSGPAVTITVSRMTRTARDHQPSRCGATKRRSVNGRRSLDVLGVKSTTRFGVLGLACRGGACASLGQLRRDAGERQPGAAPAAAGERRLPAGGPKPPISPPPPTAATVGAGPPVRLAPSGGAARLSSTASSSLRRAPRPWRAPRRSGARWPCSSAWVPSATTRPSSSSSTRSARAIVESRWAMTIVVRSPASASSSASWISCSTATSMADVASSRTRIGGFGEQRAGDGDALALAARERVAPLADDGVVAVGERRR